MLLSAQPKIKKITRKTRKHLLAQAVAPPLVAASSAESCMWKRSQTVTGKSESLMTKKHFDGFLKLSVFKVQLFYKR